jgi:hypothetical protein
VDGVNYIRIVEALRQHQDCNLRECLLEKFELLARLLRVEAGETRNSPTGTPHACDHIIRYRIDYYHEDDGDIRGSFLGSPGCHCTEQSDDVYIETDQFGSKFREPLDPPIRKSRLDDEVAALDIAQAESPAGRF